MWGENTIDYGQRNSTRISLEPVMEVVNIVHLLKMNIL